MINPENLVTLDATAIRRRREALGWTQIGLAKLAGISRGTVRNIEYGQPIHERTARMVEAALSRGESGPAGGEAIPQRHGLYYVPSDVKVAYLLTSDGGVPDLPPVERAVLVTLLRYVLGEYEGPARVERGDLPKWESNLLNETYEGGAS